MGELKEDELVVIEIDPEKFNYMESALALKDQLNGIIGNGVKIMIIPKGITVNKKNIDQIEVMN